MRQKILSARRAGASQADAPEYNAQRPTPNAERRISKTVAFDVGCWTFALATHFGVGGFGVFFSPQGRVAESGLRHSTRNRAWGNPPWVRIPPLPPFRWFFERVRQARRQSDFRCFAFRWPVDVNDCIRLCAATRVFYARRCAARDRRFARRQMDVDSRSAFAILSAASARNVAP